MSATSVQQLQRPQPGSELSSVDTVDGMEVRRDAVTLNV